MGANLVRRLTGQECFTEDFFSGEVRFWGLFGTFGGYFSDGFFWGLYFYVFLFKGKVRFLLDQHQHFKSLKSLRIDFLHFHSFLPQIFQEPGADLLPVRGPSAWGQPSF